MLLNEVSSLKETSQALRGKWNAIESDLELLKTEFENKKTDVNNQKKMGDLVKDM